MDPSKGAAKGLLAIPSLPILEPLSETASFIYLCAQKPSLFVASLGASSYSPHAMV
jgi:hypothetical protein